jgi:glycosyltransferase involved in cell wall biosynthesis
MSKINVLHLRSSSGFYGAEGVIINLARASVTLGINSLIVDIKSSTNLQDKRFMEEAQKNGLQAKTVLCRGKIDIRTIGFIRKILKESNISILHCHDYKANFLGRLATIFLKTKTVATNHLWTNETFSLRLYEFFDAIILNFFDIVIAVSSQVAEEINSFLIFKKKLITVHNGIDLDKYSLKSNSNSLRSEFKISAQNIIIGSIGRLSVQKGFLYLLEAFNKLSKENFDATLLIVGDGPLRNYLENKARSLDIKNKVIFTGARSDMHNIYSSLDIFVISSIKEGLPLVLLEALAMKKTVIATKVGGIPSVITHGINGVLVKPRDAEGLACAMIDLLQDKNKAETLAYNARKSVESNFSMNHMAKKYKDIYKTLLS